MHLPLAMNKFIWSGVLMTSVISIKPVKDQVSHFTNLWLIYTVLQNMALVFDVSEEKWITSFLKSDSNVIHALIQTPCKVTKSFFREYWEAAHQNLVLMICFHWGIGCFGRILAKGEKLPPSRGALL